SRAYHTGARHARRNAIQKSVLMAYAIAPHAPTAAGSTPARASTIAAAGAISHSGSSGASTRTTARAAGPPGTVSRPAAQTFLPQPRQISRSPTYIRVLM